MENTEEKFDYNDIISKIKTGSPVHSINFGVNSPNTIVGFYLTAKPDLKNYMDSITDKKDISNDTLLVFESRHVVECCQIIHGSLLLAIEHNIQVRGGVYNFIDRIIETLLSYPKRYCKVIESLRYIITKDMYFTNNNSIDIFDQCTTIIYNIWFVPYATIDNIANEAIEEYKSMLKEGNNNE
jgi:hypothetical protein